MDDYKTSTSENSSHRRISPWRIIGWVCVCVVIASVISCVVLAARRSKGLARITVTALDPKLEPRDHMLPFINQKEALPDYEIFVNLSNGKSIRLGAKPDASATQGLTWRLADPVCVNDVATVRLQDQDEFISDPLAEVHIQDGSVVDGNYRFDFETERSIALGIRSFFATPIGMAITAGFLIAVLVLLFSMYPF